MTNAAPQECVKEQTNTLVNQLQWFNDPYEFINSAERHIED